MPKIIKNDCECGELKDHRAKICKSCLWKNSNLDVIKEKKCSKCSLVLPIKNFRIRLRHAKIRPRSWCKNCEKIDCLKRSKVNKSPKPIISENQKKINKLKSLIKVRIKSLCSNITQEELNYYVEQYINQKNCQICNVNIQDLDRLLSIDHCHNTGKLRGFLCSNCNAGLGMFKDNINILTNALNYLQSSL